MVGLLLLLGNPDVACVGESKPGEGTAGKPLLRSLVGELGAEGVDRPDAIERREDREGDGEGDGRGDSSYMGGGTKDTFRDREPSPASRAACRSEAYRS